MKNIALAVLALLAAFTAGWWVNGLQHDSTQLVIERAATAAGEKSRKEAEKTAAGYARILENSLQELSANEKHTETIIKTEILKPVFSNVCATPEYVRVFNESVTHSERLLSGESIN